VPTFIPIFDVLALSTLPGSRWLALPQTMAFQLPLHSILVYPALAKRLRVVRFDATPVVYSTLASRFPMLQCIIFAFGASTGRALYPGYSIFLSTGHPRRVLPTFLHYGSTFAMLLDT